MYLITLCACVDVILAWVFVLAENFPWELLSDFEADVSLSGRGREGRRQPLLVQPCWDSSGGDLSSGSPRQQPSTVSWRHWHHYSLQETGETGNQWLIELLPQKEMEVGEGGCCRVLAVFEDLRKFGKNDLPFQGLESSDKWIIQLKSGKVCEKWIIQLKSVKVCEKLIIQLKSVKVCEFGLFLTKWTACNSINENTRLDSFILWLI